MLKPFRRDAYTLDAIVEAGVEPQDVRRLLVDGPNAIPERARLSIHGRKRSEPTREYGWGPDLNFLLGLGDAPLDAVADSD